MVSPHPNDPGTQIPEIMKKHRNCILTGLHRHVFGKRRCRRIAEKLLSSRSIIPIPRSAFENHSLHSKTRDRKKSPTPFAETRRRRDGKMKKRGREKKPQESRIRRWFACLCARISCQEIYFSFSFFHSCFRLSSCSYQLLGSTNLTLRTQRVKIPSERAQSFRRKLCGQATCDNCMRLRTTWWVLKRVGFSVGLPSRPTVK